MWISLAHCIKKHLKYTGCTSTLRTAISLKMSEAAYGNVRIPEFDRYRVTDRWVGDIKVCEVYAEETGFVDKSKTGLVCSLTQPY